MRGMPQLYYASGGGRRPQWVGSVLVVDDAADVRRLYQREDALPLTEDEPGPAAHRWWQGSKPRSCSAFGGTIR